MTATALVVAEDPGRREAIVSALTPSFGTFEAEGGLDGLKRLLDTSVDCVAVTVDLGDLPLVGFIDRVCQDYPAVPVIVVGRPTDPDLPIRTLRAGAFEHALSTETLLDHAERAVAGRRADTALDRHRRLGGVLCGVARDVLAGSSREEVERTVYEHLATAGLYQVVCVGDYSADDGDLEVRLPVEGTFPAGSTEIPSRGGDDHVLDKAVETGEVTVSDVPVRTRSSAVVATAGLNIPTIKTAVVPFVHGGSVIGIALVSTAEDAAFDASERSVLGDLGALTGAALQQSAGGQPDELPATVENLVHELRNPLGIALAHLELGREKGDSTSLDRAERALQQIDDLINDVSLIPSNDGGIEVVTTRELADTVAAAWDTLDAPDAEVVVAESAPVAADHRLAERLLANLFRNAVEHGGDEVTVRLGMTPDGFFVEDDGPGIPASDRDRVFERGYSTGTGSGVGLNLVADIADAHGWEVDLTESEGGGARFEISGVASIDDDEQTDG